MTTAPDWAEKEAREVVNRGGFDSPDDLVNAIAASLRAARTVTPGYVRVGETDHRVLGTLPMTADGAIAMPESEVFHPDVDPDKWTMLVEVALSFKEADDGDFPLAHDCEYVAHFHYDEYDTGYHEHATYDVRYCYSTKEAAACKSVGGGK